MLQRLQARPIKALLVAQICLLLRPSVCKIFTLLSSPESLRQFKPNILTSSRPLALFWRRRSGRGWDSNTQPSVCGANALTNCAIAAVSLLCNIWTFTVKTFRVKKILDSLSSKFMYTCLTGFSQVAENNLVLPKIYVLSEKNEKNQNFSDYTHVHIMST